MNTSEIKLDLFRRLDNLDDKKLEQMYDRIVNLIDTDNPKKKELSPEIKEALDEALGASSEGKVYTHEEAKQKTREKYPDLFR